MKNRIYVDFNTTMMDTEERVYLGRKGFEEVSDHILSSLKSGDLVILYDEEMQVEATVEFDRERQVWLARPNWTTRRDLLP